MDEVSEKVVGVIEELAALGPSLFASDTSEGPGPQ